MKVILKTVNPGALLKLKYNAFDIKPEEVTRYIDYKDYIPVVIFIDEAIVIDSRETYLKFKYYDCQYLAVTKDIL